MARKLDGAAVLRGILDHLEAFPAIRADLDLAAEKALAKQLKARTLTLSGCRRIAAAVGLPSFALALEALPSPALKSLHTKLDKHHANQEPWPDAARGAHLLKLAEGSVEPMEKPASDAGEPKTTRKAPKGKTATTKKTAEERFLEHSAFHVNPAAKDKSKAAPAAAPAPEPTSSDASDGTRASSTEADTKPTSKSKPKSTTRRKSTAATRG